MTTNTYTDHDYRMMALAAGYEISFYMREDGGPSIKIRDLIGNSAGGGQGVCGAEYRGWNPTTGQDFINLIADARIDIEWFPTFGYIKARSNLPSGDIAECKTKISDHPSPTAAMIAAGLECAIAKGLATQKEEGDEKS